MQKVAGSALLSLLLALPTIAACSASMPDAEGNEPELEEEMSVDEGALSSQVSCDTERQAAYSGGRNLGSVEVIKVGGKRVTQKTANAFLKLQKLAAARGVDVWINSGFRTMAEQQHFYNCYRTGSCNNGNLAARPGYSNHQNGRALDLGTSNRSKLNQIIRSNNLDWRLTVPSEAWHYEYFGPYVSGPCDGGGNGGTDNDTAGGDDGDNNAPVAGCYSPTLGKRVDDKVCVQGAANRVWFQCKAGSWERGGENGTGPFGDCAAKHPL